MLRRGLTPSLATLLDQAPAAMNMTRRAVDWRTDELSGQMPDLGVQAYEGSAGQEETAGGELALST